MADDFRVDFPVLWVATDWIERHCVIPDGFRQGQPFVLPEWQLWFFANHYRIKPEANLLDDEGNAMPARGASAFFYRRSQVIMPQKIGKGPMSAAHTCLEGVGPAMFAGWAKAGDQYRCEENGCPCGWVYDYAPGEPMGALWPTPLIQITAFSEEQTGNVFDALRPMILKGPLDNVIPRVTEDFIRLPGGGRIDAVTSSAQSRLGQRVTFVLQDEAMDLRTPLPTPTGWTTMGEVAVGDHLIGADGRPVRVVKATPVQHERTCYRVSFADGTSVVVSDGHLWQTRVAQSGAKPRVRTTGEMVADGRRFMVPRPDAYELPEAELPVNPYLLGLWLGDGATGAPVITAHEDEIEELAEHLRAVGAEPRIDRPAERAPRMFLSRRAGFQGSERPAYVKALQELDCYRDKHVPEVYLRASRAQREALLQGLMDSDGHVTEAGHCTFAGNDRLSADVLALLRTLGHVGQRVRHDDPRARTGEGWKVNFKPRGGLRPFRLARKAARVQPWTGPAWEAIVAIEPVQSVPVRCVGVDSEDHLFLAGEGGHVTHNTQLWTEVTKMVKVATTQRRGAAGMDGRVCETTNAYDPAENSVAQQTAEAAMPDVFRLHRQAPHHLSYTSKAERRRIHAHVYAGSPWVNLDTIEGEAAELIAKGDPGQAERFFGNRIVAGSGQWMDDEDWAATEDAQRVVPEGTEVCGGFDGSENDDWTAIRLETFDGFGFTPTYGPDARPTVWNPKEWGGKIPKGEVHAAWSELARRYKLVRVYCDPPYWDSEIGDWAQLYGEETFVEWPTYRPRAMYDSLIRMRTDVGSRRRTHDACPFAKTHMSNTRKAARPGDMYLLSKPSNHQKIDVAMTDTLAHEAASDARAEGWAPGSNTSRVLVFR